MKVSAQAVERRALLRVVEDEPVHHLDGRRPVREDHRRGLERLEQIGELDRQHRLRLRQRDQVDLRFEHDAERALGSDHQLRQVERPRPGRRTRRGCSRRRGAAPSGYRRSISSAHARARAAAPRDSTPLRARRPAQFASSSRASSGAEVRDRAVRQHDVLLDARDRSSCRRAPSARRSSCWPSCRRPWRGWRSRCRARTAGRAAFSCGVQLVEHDARLDARPALGGVHFQHAVEVLRGVDLTGRRRSPGRPATCRRPASSADSGCLRQSCDGADRRLRATSRRRRPAARSGRRWRRWSRARARPCRTGPRPRDRDSDRGAGLRVDCEMVPRDAIIGTGTEDRARRTGFRAS